MIKREKTEQTKSYRIVAKSSMNGNKMTLFCHDFRPCMMFVDPASSLQLCSVSPLLHCHLRQSAMSPTSMKRRLPQPFYSAPVTFVHHTVSGGFISVRRR